MPETIKTVLLSGMLLLPAIGTAADTLSGYQLVFEEQEAGTDRYSTRMTVASGFLRIDTVNDNSGHIVYDRKAEAIYSISHANKSILVINRHVFKKPDMSNLVNESYHEMKDAPAIGGHNIINYKLVSKQSPDKEICASIQIASGLLPEVTGLLQSYWELVAGQQVKTLVATPEEFRTPCFLADGVYNTGEYYSKGLPVQEWHSNGKVRMLKSYKKIEVEQSLFEVPEEYYRYSLD